MSDNTIELLGQRVTVERSGFKCEDGWCPCDKAPLTFITYTFPDSVINTVSQTGVALTPYKKGVSVALGWLHGQEVPHLAEVYSVEKDDEEYAEVGLEWDGRKLTGYDGIFEIPNEVIAVLEHHGFDCSEVKEKEEDMSDESFDEMYRSNPITERWIDK
jgi:hypothetical protein